MNTTPGNRALGIRGRLLLLLLIPLGIILILSIGSDYRLAVDPANQAYDHGLANSVVALASQLSTAGGKVSLDLSPEAVSVLRTDRFDKIYYLVLGPHAEFIAGDKGMPVAPTEIQQAGEQNPSFFNASYAGAQIRVAVYRLPTPEGMVSVQVAETMHKRERAANRIVAALVWPAMLLIVTTLILVYFGVRIGLRPLTKLSDEIQARSPRDLHPLPAQPIATELEPLVSAINHLLGLLRKSAQTQQQFLANAAHQLRTPLAGLQAQLEVAADDLPPDKRHRIDRLREGTRRLGHLANQLLSLARSAPDANLVHDAHPFDLRAAVEEATASFVDQAVVKDIDLGADAQPATAAGSKWLIRELLANLIDNAIIYTPMGGRVTVRSGVDAAAAFLEVEDNGPGIPEAERSRICERFYRIPGSAGEGCGLGLAIVREIADLHNAQIDIAAAPGGQGTRVRVVFPPQPLGAAV